MARILLIDDTPEIAELLTFALRDRGHEVFATGYTTSVNELLAEHQADALVLDCSGFDMSDTLFDSVREDANYATLPVIIITDIAQQAEHVLRSRNAQNVLIVQKPFTAGQVANALAQLLG